MTAVRGARITAAALSGLLVVPGFARAASGSIPTKRVVEIVADKDNTFKIPGERKPVTVAKPGEVFMLKVRSLAGPETAKDGAVHSIVIKSLRNQGWDVRLKPGTQQFELRAPRSSGQYVIECTVKCGRGHEDMRMTLIVKP